MTEDRNVFEGQTVDGLYPLGDRLGRTRASDVFVTASAIQTGGKAAIKLVPADSCDADRQLAVWEQASRWSHPNLMRVERSGRCTIGGVDMLYVVTECADEVLADVLKERPLSAVEARQLIEPVVDALTYIHGQGYAHGSVRVSNIFAVREQLKLSCDRLRPLSPETEHEDVQALAATVAEVLTQRRPATVEDVTSLPEPFGEIVRHGLAAELSERWTLARIASHLRGESSRRAGGVVAMARRYATPLAVAATVFVVLAIWTWPGFGPSQPPETTGRDRDVVPVARQGPDDRPSPMPPPRTAEPGPPPVTATRTGENVTSEPADPAPTSTAASMPAEVIRFVLPDVPARALRTVTGRPRLSVRVRIDGLGNVSAAELDSPGPSRYFAELALDAARKWKFTSAPGERQRVIWFLFSREGPQVTAVQ